MTKEDDIRKKTLTLNKSDRLELTPLAKRQVLQSFPRGKSNTVVVQERKKRVFERDSSGTIKATSEAHAVPVPVIPEIIPVDVSIPEKPAFKQQPQFSSSGRLTQGEQLNRFKVLREAEVSRQEEDAKRKIEEEKKQKEREEYEALLAQKALELPEPSDDEDEEENAVDVKQEIKRPLIDQSLVERAEVEEVKNTKKIRPTAELKRSTTRALLARVLVSNDDEIDDQLDKDSFRRGSSRYKVRRKNKNKFQKPVEKLTRDVILPETITVQELANRMSERAVDVVRVLMKMGMLVTITQTIDADTAELVITELGHSVKRVTEGDVESILLPTLKEEDESLFLNRAPVVTIMGHVDHGKTSLLDALRTTDVVSKESGGITQHIGAYRLKTESGHYITFLDTPGHQAFTEMRIRGAKITDIVVLVVAADDGIMEQTIEAINHAKAANVVIIVAINKIDKPDADPSKTKNELLQHGLIPEELGGDIMVVEVSAKQKIGLENLEEIILLQAEMLELKANNNCPASGVVIEASLDKGKGTMATFLVQRGTLRCGDIIVVGGTEGRVRSLTDDKGVSIKEATPSMPVAVVGLSDVPNAGDPFNVVPSEKQAREIALYRRKREADLRVASSKKGSLEQMFKVAAEGSKTIAMVIRADVKGSAEAIAQSVKKLSNDEVEVIILHTGVGAITESDVTLAKASNAMLIGFNVRANQNVKALSDQLGLDIRYHSIIYNIIDDVKAVLSGMLSPILREHYLGSAEIRKIFEIKNTKIAGSFVTQGVIKRGSGVRLLRNDVVIHEGKLKTLRRFKEDVKEVANNFECGIAFENYTDIREGDTLEAFEVIEEKRTL